MSAHSRFVCYGQKLEKLECASVSKREKETMARWKSGIWLSWQKEPIIDKPSCWDASYRRRELVSKGCALCFRFFGRSQKSKLGGWTSGVLAELWRWGRHHSLWRTRQKVSWDPRTSRILVAAVTHDSALVFMLIGMDMQRKHQF